MTFLLLGWSVSSVYAASVASQFYNGALNLLSDNSAESLIGGNDTVIDVGERFRGIIDFNTNEALSPAGPQRPIGQGGVNYLTAFFDITVVSKVDTGAAGSGRFQFGFAPTAGFATELAGLSNVSLTAAELSGTMLALFEDDFATGTPFSRTGASEAADIAVATDGTFRMALGFGLDSDELWATSSFTDDVAIAATTAPPSNGGTNNIQLSIISNLFPNLTFAQVNAGQTLDDGLIDINASGSLLGTQGVSTPWDIFDNNDVVFRPNAVPEPSTITMMGIGLLSLGAVAYRRRKAKSN